MNGPSGKALAEQRAAFLERVEGLRPRLHRYCTRLLDSPLDGEDVVQDALAQAFFKSPILGRPEDLDPWIFRVAHNRCMDLLRRRKVREEAARAPVETSEAPADPVVGKDSVDRAFRRLLATLPPKERAAVVLKDVLDFSLREVAEIIESTEGGVKAALHRARGKLRQAASDPPEVALDAAVDDPQHRLLEEYAERFNARDFAGLTSLLAADARLQVLEVFEGRGPDGFRRHYFHNYSRFTMTWRARPVRIAGETVMLVERGTEAGWCLYSVVRVTFDEGRIRGVRDYIHVPPYLLDALGEFVDSGPPAGFQPEDFDPVEQ